MEYALSKHPQNEEVRLNAVSGSTAFAEFSKELVEEFELALSIRS